VEHAASATTTTTTTTTDDSNADWQPGVETDSNGKLMLNADGGCQMPSRAHAAAMDTIVLNLQVVYIQSNSLQLEARISSPYFLCV